LPYGELNIFTLTHLSPLRCTVASKPPLKGHNSKTGFINMLGGKKMEHCKNPWKSTCHSENIKLYIMVKGQKLPICNQCWTQIANGEEEW
jgi:hypothetical protein